MRIAKLAVGGTVVTAVLIALTFALINCGGGGGSSTPLTPPAFTNLAGTRWQVRDTVTTSSNTCGVASGTADNWVLHVVSQSGNTIAFYDERSGSSGAVNGTMSGYNVTYSGERYPVYGCTTMMAAYNITVNTSGTGFTGSVTVTCLDNGCSAPAGVSGTKLP
jgi:hypothetical protein